MIKEVLDGQLAVVIERRDRIIDNKLTELYLLKTEAYLNEDDAALSDREKFIKHSTMIV